MMLTDDLGSHCHCPVARNNSFLQNSLETTNVQSSEENSLRKREEETLNVSGQNQPLWALESESWKNTGASQEKTLKKNPKKLGNSSPYRTGIHKVMGRSH